MKTIISKEDFEIKIMNKISVDSHRINTIEKFRVHCVRRSYAPQGTFLRCSIFLDAKDDYLSIFLREKCLLFSNEFFELFNEYCWLYSFNPGIFVSNFLTDSTYLANTSVRFRFCFETKLFEYCEIVESELLQSFIQNLKFQLNLNGKFNLSTQNKIDFLEALSQTDREFSLFQIENFLNEKLEVNIWRIIKDYHIIPETIEEKETNKNLITQYFLNKRLDSPKIVI